MPGLAGVVGIASGDTHALAVTSDGSVWVWGYQFGGGWAGTLFSPTQFAGLDGVSAVAATVNNDFALKGGQVWAWGIAQLGQLGLGVWTGGNWGSIPFTNTPIQIPGLENIVALAVGDNHTLALKADGTVYAWGLNDHSQAGNNRDPAPGCLDVTYNTYRDCSSNPTEIPFPGASPVIAIAAGSATSLALRADGTVWGWGLSSLGSLGAALPVGGETAIPVQIPGISNATAIATSGQDSLALTADGSLWSWGNWSLTPAPVPQYNSFSTAYPAPPSWPASNLVTVTNVSQDSAGLAWPAAGGAVQSYVVVANGSIVATAGGDQTAVVIAGLPSDTDLTFVVQACDFSQTACASSPPVTVHTPPPLHWPDNAQLTVAPAWFTASASWPAAEPAAMVSAYRADLWRTDTWEWLSSTSFAGSQRALVLEGLVPDVGYQLEISACDPLRCVYLFNDFRTLARVPVTIDIRPGASPNDVNLSSDGQLPVAVLSSQTFDARTIDPSTVTLAGVPALIRIGDDDRREDTDRDGRRELVVRFPIPALAWQLDQNSTSATLEAATTDGVAITGTDSLRIVPTGYAKTPGLDNGDFEQGLKSWFGQGWIATTHDAFSGKLAALVGARKEDEEGGDDAAAIGPDSFVAQSFQVPADGAVLGLRYQVSCASDPSLGWAAATLVDDTDHSSTSLLEPTCTNDGSWQEARLRMKANAGHLVTLRLQNHDAAPASSGTSTRFDAVTLVPLPPDPVVNGGFQSGDLRGWTVAPPPAFAAVVPDPFAPPGPINWVAQVGSRFADSSITQTFTVPAIGGVLSLRYQGEPSMGGPGGVRAILTDTVTGQTLDLLSGSWGYAGMWTQASADVTPFAGHAVTLELGFQPSWFSYSASALFDDVSVQWPGARRRPRPPRRGSRAPGRVGAGRRPAPPARPGRGRCGCSVRGARPAPRPGALGQRPRRRAGRAGQGALRLALRARGRPEAGRAHHLRREVRRQRRRDRPPHRRRRAALDAARGPEVRPGPRALVQHGSLGREDPGVPSRVGPGTRRRGGAEAPGARTSGPYTTCTSGE